MIRKCNPTDPSQYAEYDYVTPWEEDKGTILTINDNSITGDTIIHLEGGSYKRMHTEDMYNHISEEFKCEYIKDLLSPNNSEETGKLYMLVKWKNVQESLIDADILKRDESG